MNGLTCNMKSSGKYKRWEEGECTLLTCIMDCIRLYIMDRNSVKQIKKLFTEMFNDHYRKMCDMYNGLEKSTVK